MKMYFTMIPFEAIERNTKIKEMIAEQADD